MAPKDRNLAQITSYIKSNDLKLPLDIIVFIGLEITKRIAAEHSKPLSCKAEDIYISDEAQIIIVPSESSEDEDSLPSIGSMILDLMDLGDIDDSSTASSELIHLAQKAISGEIKQLEYFRQILRAFEKKHCPNPNIVRKVAKFLAPLYANSTDPKANDIISFAEAKRTIYLKNQKKLHKTNQIAKAIILTCFVAALINFLQITQEPIDNRGPASLAPPSEMTFKSLLKDELFDEAEIFLLKTPREDRNHDWELQIEDLVLEKVKSLLKKGRTSEIEEMILTYQTEYEFLQSSEKLNQVLDAQEAD